MAFPESLLGRSGLRLADGSRSAMGPVAGTRESPPVVEASFRLGARRPTADALRPAVAPPRPNWAVVNGQVAVPAGGQLKVPTPRVDHLSFRAVPPRARAWRMRYESPAVSTNGTQTVLA